MGCSEVEVAANAGSRLAHEAKKATLKVPPARGLADGDEDEDGDEDVAGELQAAARSARTTDTPATLRVDLPLRINMGDSP
jgi:hypothetical protein